MREWAESRGFDDCWCAHCRQMTSHEVMRRYRERPVCRFCLPYTGHMALNVWKDCVKQRGVCGDCGNEALVTKEKAAERYLVCRECDSRREPPADIWEARGPVQTEPEAATLLWEVLPTGTTPAGHLAGERDAGVKPSAATQRYEDRLVFIDGLGPLRWWRGVPLKGGRHYFVAEFKRCIVADSPLIGNAIYLYRNTDKETWQRVFSRSKVDARSLGAVRITHQGDWRTRLQAEIFNLR